MPTTTIMAGKWEMSIGNVLIPAELLGELNVNYEEGTSEAETQAGTITTPNGKAETAEATTTIYLPSFDYLKNIYSDVYNAGTGTLAGNVIFGSNSCQTQTPVEVNIHPVCEATDDNDIHFSALIAHTFDLTLSTSDPVSIETTMYLQPTESNGRLRVGTGDLTQQSYYDVTSQTTKPYQAPSA